MARDFNGTTDRIDYAGISGLTNDDPISVFFNLYLDTIVGQRYYLLIHNSGDADNARIFWGDQGVLKYTCDYATANLFVLSDGAVESAGAWMRICFTHDGGTAVEGARIYLNGSEVSYNTIIDTPGSGAGTSSLGSWSLGGRIFDNLRNVNGRMANVGVWNEELTPEEVASFETGISPLAVRRHALVRAPDLIRAARDPITGDSGTLDGTTVIEHPRTIFPSAQILRFPSVGGTALGGTIGQVTEQDLAQAFAALKLRLLGQVIEQDSAQAFASSKAKAIGQVLENDSAQPFSASGSAQIGQVTETDSAQAMTSAKDRAIGQVLESDSAVAFTPARIYAIGFVTENDSVFSLSPAKYQAIAPVTENDSAFAFEFVGATAIGQVLEQDSAQALASSKAKAIGLVSENDSAQALTAEKYRAVGQVVENDSAQAMTSAKNRAIGQVLENDSAFAFSPVRIYPIGVATENDSVQSLTSAKGRTIGQALEVNWVWSVTVYVPVVFDPDSPVNSHQLIPGRILNSDQRMAGAILNSEQRLAGVVLNSDQVLH